MVTYAADWHASELNPQSHFFKKINENPPDVVFKDIVKFDAQNSIIGSLLTQIESSKVTLKGIKTLDKVFSDLKN